MDPFGSTSRVLGLLWSHCLAQADSGGVTAAAREVGSRSCLGVVDWDGDALESQF